MSNFDTRIAVEEIFDAEERDLRIDAPGEEEWTLEDLEAEFDPSGGFVADDFDECDEDYSTDDCGQFDSYDYYDEC